MFRCDLFSLEGLIPPAKVDVSYVLLDGCVGKGSANVTYSFAQGELTTSAYYFTAATYYFAQDGQYCGESVLNSLSMTSQSSKGSNTQLFSVDEILDADSNSNAYQVLSTSGNAHSSHADMVLRVDGQPGLKQLQFSMGFLLEVRGRFSNDNGDACVLSYCNTWPSSTIVDYALSCHLCNCKRVTVKVEDYPSGSLKWRMINAKKCLYLTYTKADNSKSLGDVDLTFSLNCEKTANATSTLFGYSNHQWLPHSYILNVSLPPLSCDTHSSSNTFYPGEFIFLIDCSGSMSGMNILETTKAIHVALKSLPLHSYFNVIAFGSKFRNAFSTSVEYSPDNLVKAAQFVNQLDTTLGGTDLLSPLRWLTKQPCLHGLARQIFIITDGEASSPANIISLMQHHARDVRCHLFGIGGEACSVLLSSLAAVTKGTSLKVTDPVLLPKLLISTLEKCALSPQICNALVSLQLQDWSIVEEYSQINWLNACYGSFHYFVLKPNKPGDVTVQGNLHVSGMKQVERVSFNFFINTLASDNAEVNGVLPLLIGWKKLHKFICTKDKSNLEAAVATSKIVGLRCCYAEFICKNECSYLTTLPSLLASAYTNQTTCEGKPAAVYRSRKRMVPESAYSVPELVKAKVSSWFGSVVSIATSVLGLSSKEEDAGDIEYSLDDLEMQQESKKGLHWGDQGQLVIPDCYYKNPCQKPVSSSDDSPVGLQKKSIPLVKRSPDNHGINAKNTESISGVSFGPPKDFFPLLKLQLYDGTWLLDSTFYGVLGLSQSDVTFSTLLTLPIHMSSSDKDKAIATVVAISVFHIFWTDCQVIWRMAISKGCSWLLQWGVEIESKEAIEVKAFLQRLYGRTRV